MPGEHRYFDPADPSSWIKCRVDSSDADRLVGRGGGFILSVTLVSSGGNADAVIRDGTSGAGTVIHSMLALQNYSQHDTFYPGIRFNQGVYIDVGSNVGLVLVQYVLDTDLVYP